MSSRWNGVGSVFNYEPDEIRLMAERNAYKYMEELWEEYRPKISENHVGKVIITGIPLGKNGFYKDLFYKGDK